MTRRSAVLVVGTIALLIVALGWYGFPGLAREQGRRSETVAGPRPTPQQGRQVKAAPPSPTRDLFTYAGASDRASTAPPPPSATPESAAGDAPAPPAPRVRLVGFLHSEGRLAAALAIDSTVDVAQAGESVRGYRILALDEERATVRLLTPEGQEIEVGSPAP